MPTLTTTSVINIKSYGAVGDGVTSDQTAFDNALADLPAEGGTIRFPIGTYLLPDGMVLHDSGVSRNNVRLVGEDRENTIVLCNTDGTNGLELSVYRRGGWETDIDDVVPYEDTLRIGQNWIKPKDAADLASFSVGDKIFIAAGSSMQFDQEYGEFNRVKRIDNTNDRIILEKNLLRDYRTEYATWNAVVDSDFTVPAVDDTPLAIQVEVLTNDGVPGSLTAISIGNDLYDVDSTNYTSGTGVFTWNIVNKRASNDVAVGQTITAGTKIFKQRVIIKTPQTTSGTVVENLTINADGDTVNLSNSMDTLLRDVNLIRQDDTGGLWADFDDGRNAKFINCKIEQEGVWDASQPARSFAELEFNGCEFINAGIDWSEFSCKGSVINSKFFLENPTDVTTTYAISMGWSTTDMRIEGCEIYGDNISNLISIAPDINGFQGAWRGGFIIANNRLYANNCDKFLEISQAGTTDIYGNHFFGDAEALMSINGHRIPDAGDGLRELDNQFVNSSFVNFHHNFFAGTIDTINLVIPHNLVMENNWFHWQGARDSVSSNFSNGSILWDNQGSTYHHIEILRVRNNTFKNWLYADGSTPGGPGTPQNSFNFDATNYPEGATTDRIDISGNLFLDPQQTYIGAGNPLLGESEFIIDLVKP